MGPLLVAAAVFVLFFSTEVSCGGEQMSPGDVCESTRYGVTTTYTFEERRAYWARIGWIGGAAGLAFAGYGVWKLRSLRREEKLST
jgi:hypothetical protein